MYYILLHNNIAAALIIAFKHSLQINDVIPNFKESIKMDFTSIFGFLTKRKMAYL